MSSFQLDDPGHEAVRRLLVQRHGSSRFQCAAFTRAFQQRFPDLRRVAGFYHGVNGAPLGEHWWLEDSTGRIVDPTADQFACQGRGRYVRYDPQQHTVVKGKCMHCGTGLHSREGSYPCSRSCAEALAREYGCRIADGPYEDEMEFDSDADILETYGPLFTLAVEPASPVPRP